RVTVSLRRGGLDNEIIREVVMIHLDCTHEQVDQVFARAEEVELVTEAGLAEARETLSQIAGYKDPALESKKSKPLSVLYWSSITGLGFLGVLFAILALIG